MDDGEEDRVVAERLPDLGVWEFYLFSFETSGDAVCRVALHAGSADEVEYGIFRGEDGEPSASGAIVQSGSWSDKEREAALKEILTIYQIELPELRTGVVFELSGEHERDAEEGKDEDFEEDGA